MQVVARERARAGGTHGGNRQRSHCASGRGPPRDRAQRDARRFRRCVSQLLATDCSGEADPGGLGRPRPARGSVPSRTAAAIRACTRRHRPLRAGARAAATTDGGRGRLCLLPHRLQPGEPNTGGVDVAPRSGSGEDSSAGGRCTQAAGGVRGAGPARPQAARPTGTATHRNPPGEGPPSRG